MSLNGTAICGIAVAGYAIADNGLPPYIAGGGVVLDDSHPFWRRRPRKEIEALPLEVQPIAVRVIEEATDPKEGVELFKAPLERRAIQYREVYGEVIRQLMREEEEEIAVLLLM